MSDFRLRLFQASSRCAALLGLILLLIQSAPAEPTGEETKMFESARQAFDDGLFDVSDQRFAAFLKKFPNSDYRFEAHLQEGRALYYLGRYDLAQNLLDLPVKQVPDKFQADFLFWQAETFLAESKWSDAEGKYRDFLGQFPNHPQFKPAQINLAWALLNQNKEQEGTDLLKSVAAEAGLPAQRAALILAKYALAKNKVDDAASQLETLIAHKPKPEIFFEACTWLGDIRYQQNKANDAVTQYRKVTDNDRAFPKNILAQAWFGLGRAYQALSQQDNAMLALEKAFTLSDAEQLKLSAFKLYLTSATALKQLPDAVAKLQDFAAQNKDKPEAASALFAIALAQAESQNETAAITVLQQLLNNYSKSRWRAAASFELGKLYQDQNKPTEAVKALQTSIDGNENSEVSQKAQFEIGSILFGQKDYNGCLSYFQKAAQAGGDIGEKALFNLLQAEARLNQIDAFSKTEDQFISSYPQSPFRDKVALEKASLLKKLGKLDQARETYEKALAASSGTQHPLVMIRLGDLLYQSGKPSEALQYYDKLISQYPDDALVTEATYKSVMANLAVQKITADQALKSLSDLLEKHAGDAQAPSILFGMGELAFNKQDYVNAQTSFESLAKNYPQSDLADDAYYWAGKAALAHDDLGDALQILEKIPEKSPLKIDARLLQGKIYHRQMKFDDAIVLFDAVISAEKSGPRYIEALLRKGDCYFALGSSDSNRYELASAAYGLVLNSTQGNLAQRNEAGFKRAKCLQKLKRDGDALALYLDVMNGRLFIPTDAAPIAPPEFLWQVKAGIEAATIRENQQDWKGAIEVYRKLEQMGGPNQQQFHDVITKLRRDHYLFDEG